MAKIIFLGTSSSVASPQRDNTSLLFSAGKNHILIDCPGSIVHKLGKTGVDFRKLEDIVITHQHIDHYYGLLGLIHAQGRLNRNLTVYANRATIRLLKKLIAATGLEKPQYPRVIFGEVQPGRTFYRSRQVTLKAIGNNHAPDSFGIQFSLKTKKVLYSSDTALSVPIIAAAKKCDYLIHDCTASSMYFKKYPQLFRVHTNARDLARFVKDTRIRKLIPIHFLLLEKNELRKIRDELSPLGKRVFLPSDFDRLIC